MTWLRIGLSAGAVLAVAILVSTVVLWRYAGAHVPRTSIAALASDGSSDVAAAPSSTSLDILVLVLDDPGELTAPQRDAFGAQGGGQVTDTVLLVQLRPDRDRPVVVAFPRELKVEVPGLGDHQLSEVHALGGPELLVEVLEDYTGIELDHYAEVSLAGVLDLVDDLGGTDVCLERPMDDAFAAVRLSAGCADLAGVEAAGFVRLRQAPDEFGQADAFGRLARQQFFVGQLLSQATSPRTLLNPFRLKSMIDGVAGAVRVDAAIGPRQLLAVGRALAVPAAVDVRVVPGFFSAETGYVHAYPEATAALLQALREGEPLPDEVGLAAPEDIVAADVRVMVLNGDGANGLAGLVADHLTTAGFVVVGRGDNDVLGVQRSLILTTAIDEPRARLLAALLPDAEVRIVDRLAFTNVHVVLVIGSDRAGVPVASSPPQESNTEVDG